MVDGIEDIQDFADLEVWRRSHALALGVYRSTRAFPAEERFEMTSQLQRAAVSVCANIAEGSRREGRNDYARFLNIAQGSLSEVACLILLSRDLGYLPTDIAARHLADGDEIAKMLHALRKRVRSNSDRTSAVRRPPTSNF